MILIKDLLLNQVKNNTILERFILNGFGYHLLLFLMMKIYI